MPPSAAATALLSHPGALDRTGGHRDEHGLYHRHQEAPADPAPASAYTSGGAATIDWMDRFQLRPPEWAVLSVVVILALWAAIRLDRWIRFRRFGSPEFRRREKKKVR